MCAMFEQLPAFQSPVAILGWGLSGRAAAALLERAGVRTIAFDESGQRAHPVFNKQYARRFTQVIYSPGFPTNHRWLRIAKECGCQCIGELDLGSLYWRGATVAITGTNGKTTLTSFLAEALRASGFGAKAVGNIGVPFSSVAYQQSEEHPIAVCEVSSFQAESIRYFSPQAVLWTNFAGDHLDRHGDEKSYFAAKWKLVERLRRPRLVIGESVAECAAKYGFRLPAFTRVVTREEVRQDLPANSIFASGPQSENYAIARAYWKQEGLDMAVLKDVAKKFSGLPHRLRCVCELGDVSFWNDSKATNLAATHAALDSFSKPVLWIGGGQGKGESIKAHAQRLAKRVKAAFLIGETAPELTRLLGKEGIDAQRFTSMQDAVKAAYHRASAGDFVVFSPGFASFDMYDNYANRGEIFERCVLNLKSPDIDSKHTASA